MRKLMLSSAQSLNDKQTAVDCVELKGVNR